METDRISEQLLAEAYQAGWDHYPSKKLIPWKWNKNKILQDAFTQGWEDHLKEPSPVSFTI
jgi:hypothetical protein